MDLKDGRCFKAEGSEETSGMLSPEDIVKHDKLVRETDEREIKAFVDDKVFKLCPWQKASNTMD